MQRPPLRTLMDTVPPRYQRRGWKYVVLTVLLAVYGGGLYWATRPGRIQVRPVPRLISVRVLPWEMLIPAPPPQEPRLETLPTVTIPPPRLHIRHRRHG